jgi:hypothetical protein
MTLPTPTPEQITKSIITQATALKVTLDPDIHKATLQAEALMKQAAKSPDIAHSAIGGLTELHANLVLASKIYDSRVVIPTAPVTPVDPVISINPRIDAPVIANPVVTVTQQNTAYTPLLNDIVSPTTQSPVNLSPASAVVSTEQIRSYSIGPTDTYVAPNVTVDTVPNSPYNQSDFGGVNDIVAEISSWLNPVVPTKNVTSTNYDTISDYKTDTTTNKIEILPILFIVAIGALIIYNIK